MTINNKQLFSQMRNIIKNKLSNDTKEMVPFLLMKRFILTALLKMTLISLCLCPKGWEFQVDGPDKHRNILTLTSFAFRMMKICVSDNECRLLAVDDWRSRVTWSDLGALRIIHLAVFLTFWSFLTRSNGRPERKVLQ